VSSGRFVANEAEFKLDAFAVLKTHFAGKRAFDRYYAAISDEKIDEFLRVCASYRYLAKHGDWKIKVRGYNPVIDYLTNSYKLVAVFSLIESLSPLKHLDFYQWLTAKNREPSFPIASKGDLEKLYAEYKADYGAIRRCIKFFSSLPQEEQERLCNSISVKGRQLAQIKKLAEILYNLRSSFVHNAEFAHALNGPILVSTRFGVVKSQLSVAAVLRAFELGVIEHFRG